MAAIMNVVILWNVFSSVFQYLTYVCKKDFHIPILFPHPAIPPQASTSLILVKLRSSQIDCCPHSYVFHVHTLSRSLAISSGTSCVAHIATMTPVLCTDNDSRNNEGSAKEGAGQLAVTTFVSTTFSFLRLIP
jgi:hypothetical protein